MMKLICRTAVAAAILGVSVAGGWACTDDSGNELTLEEYFERLVALDDDFSERGDAAFEDVSDDPEIEEVRDALNTFSGIIEDFVGELEDLEAPDEAQEAHGRAIDAGNEVHDEYEKLVDLADDAESVDDLFAATQTESFTEAFDRFTTACLDLQEIADNNNIEAALDCGE